MKRRQYLSMAVASAATLGLAGCSGDTSGNNSSNGSGGGGNTEMNSSAETETSGGDTTVASTDTEAATESETAAGTDAGMETETGTTAGGEETTAASENETEATGTETEAPTANNTESGGGNASAGGNESSSGSTSISDSGDTDVTLKSADVADAYSLDSVAFYSADMSTGVRGEVTNTTDSAISYTEISVKFYNGEGTRLGEGLDNVSDLGAGKTYAFDAISMLTAEKADAIENYTITVTDSAL